ncbi:hypothetical protein B5C34_13695 [Pacificimonas flava]|uniref:Transcription regulator PadR N-terminal domain-containing protein n=2 Tax=Pacificimonas TaxID=1960290 RepID=A0A219B7S4_9SPHN|nr:hypothetical protein B5C34_13695 [Pacificimonas flava]
MRGDWNRMFRDMGMEFAADWTLGSGGAHRGRGGRGGGRGRSRLLRQGELQHLLLALIADGPKHGYALIEEIGQMTGGSYEPSPGVVYPTLTMLADMGLVEERPEEGRKLYALTEKGREHLEERSTETEELLQRVRAAGASSGSSDYAPIARSLVNLAAALKLRGWEKRLDADTSKRIADILDEAARRIQEV